MKYKYPIIYTLLLIGFLFGIWGAIKYNNYPGMRELRDAAWHVADVQYKISLSIFSICYILTYFKNKK